MALAQLKPSFSRVLAGAFLVILSAVAWAAPKYAILHNFSGTDGSGPTSGLTLGPDGNLYGASGDGGYCGTVFELTPQENGQWRETVLYQFNSFSDGCNPQGRMIFDASGNVYLTATDGGNSYCSSGCGLVFQLAPGSSGTWAESVLFSFDFDDGAHPAAGVIMNGSGKLYGTAEVAFKLTPGSGGWQETVLHNFTGENGDGSPPLSAIISDASGNLYGTTAAGGNYPPNCPVSGGCGIVFELMVEKGERQERILHRFRGFSGDGAEPSSGVTLDLDGNLFGVTAIGGGTGCEAGCGTVYMVSPEKDGRWRERLLHVFGDGSNGSYPDGSVVADKKGNLYGMAAYGGSGCDCGVIFKLTPGAKGKWRYKVLHTFHGYDGAVPAGGLTIDSKGNLYGATVLGGQYGQGVVFEITP